MQGGKAIPYNIRTSWWGSVATSGRWPSPSTDLSPHEIILCFHQQLHFAQPGKRVAFHEVSIPTAADSGKISIPELVMVIVTCKSNVKQTRPLIVQNLKVTVDFQTAIATSRHVFKLSTCLSTLWFPGLLWSAQQALQCQTNRKSWGNLLGHVPVISFAWHALAATLIFCFLCSQTLG